MAKQEKKDIFERLSNLVNWYENPDDYPFEVELLDKQLVEEMYNTLVKVQNTYPKPEKLYDEICQKLTWHEHPEDYAFGVKEFHKDEPNMLYELSVKVLNTLYSDLMEEE